MKSLSASLIFLLLIACGSNSNAPNDDNSQVLKVSASGLTEAVQLSEEISGRLYIIPEDGQHLVSLEVGQAIYNFQVANTGTQTCHINQQLELTCELIACSTLYDPVCGKQAYTGVVCVTTPCETDRYQTYPNSCSANNGDVWRAFSGECGLLEDITTEHIEPANVLDFSLLDYQSAPFTILSSSISGDRLDLVFSITGGCGSHDFDLMVDENFDDNFPLTVSYAIRHEATDNCEATIEVEKTFDLASLQEFYRQRYTDRQGEQTIIIGQLGEFNFTLD